VNRWRPGRSVPLVGLALALGLTMTAGLVSFAVQGLIQDEEAAFGAEIGSIKDSLVQRLTSAGEMLHGMRLLFEATKTVDAEAFEVIGNDAISTNALISEVMYLPLIAGHERERFEQARQEEGYPSFRINALRGGEYAPAPPAEQHFPIVFFEPLAPLTSRRLGLDLYGEAAMRPFIQRAIDSGVATSAIPGQAGAIDHYLMFSAVYADRPQAGLDVVKERRKLVSGLVAAKVDLRGLLQTRRPIDPRVSVAVFARPLFDPSRRVAVARHDAAAATAAALWFRSALRREREVTVGDQQFFVAFRRDVHWQDLRRLPPALALFGGLLVTLMLWSLAKSIRARAEDLHRRNVDIQQVVEARTHELAAEKERVLVTLESIADGVVTADALGVVDYLNPVAERLSGWSKSEAVGRPISELFTVLDEATLREIDSSALACLRSGVPVVRHEKSLFMDRDGDTVAIDESAAPIRDAEGRTTGVVLVLHDVSHARRLRQQMSHQATHDALTGLPNRSRLLDHLQGSLETAARDQRSLAVMFLDLDRFKIVNDTLGHDAGDGLLRDVAQRLKSCLREGDIVSRLGGDEFVIVTAPVKDGQAIHVLADRVLGAFREPFMLGAAEFFATTSIGVSVFPDHGSSPETLLKAADAAMYRVKAEGKNNVGFYDEDQDLREGERLGLEAELRHALERGEIVVHYQPQFSTRSETVTGFEALVRWQHPARGLLPPAAFLPLAEETGLIVDIGSWVLHEACRQNRAWQDAGWPPVTVAVNIAHQQFMRPSLVSEVERALEETGLDARYLELELTESILADDAVAAAKRLDALKAVGVKLSIDDFGTGYSSLYHLKSFPLDSVKIDRCFIQDLASDSGDAEISAAVIAMSHSLHLSVVAEGVESRQQMDFLRRKGCDTVQGFLFSPAVPADRAEVFLADAAADALHGRWRPSVLGASSATSLAPLLF